MVIDKEASLSDKLLACSTILICFLIIFSIPGFYSDYLPSQEYLNNAQYLTSFIILIIFGLLLSSVFKSTVKNRLSLVISLSVLLIVASYCFIMLSFPFLIHKLVTKKNDSASFIVDYRNSEYFKRRPRCDGGVHIHYDVFIKNQVCGIPRYLWQNIKSGDTLELIGTKSYFGFHYSGFQLRNKFKGD